MQKLSKEKLEWMKKVGIEEFDEPMKYYLGMNYTYSEEYLKNTPLEVLQERYDKRLVMNGEQIIDDEDVK